MEPCTFQLTKSSSNVLEGARTREKLIVLLKEHEKSSAEVKEHRGFITELNFLLKQVQKEIKSLRAKGNGCDKVSYYHQKFNSVAIN